MLKLIPTLLLIFSYFILNVSSRTCVCAEFVAEACDAQMNCKWNEGVPSSGSNDHGVKGVCRSLTFYECHVDPECTLRVRDPRNNTNYKDTAIQTENEILSAMTHNYRVPGLVLGKGYDMITVDDDNDGTESDQGNGEQPNEDDRLWPYDCKTNQYLGYTISASRIDKLAQEIYQQKIEEMENKEEMVEDIIVPSKGSKILIYESLNGLQLVSGIIFIIAVIVGVIYYKFIKKNEEDIKYISLKVEDSNSYGSMFGV